MKTTKWCPRENFVNFRAQLRLCIELLASESWRRGIFDSNSAVNDSDDKSGNSNGNRGIEAEYLIRRDRGASRNRHGTAVLVPILLSGKLHRCLLSLRVLAPSPPYPPPPHRASFKRRQKKSGVDFDIYEIHCTEV